MNFIIKKVDIVKAPPLERNLERLFKQKVKELGGIAFKFQIIGRRGGADRLVVLPNYGICFVELKRTPKAKVLTSQKEIARILRRFGYQTFLVDSKESLNRWLQWAQEAIDDC